jgi:hypothetical protein
MLALNGVSISDWTGIELPFLPQFPMETWNFRIVHIAGALALGFLLFSAHTFHPDREHRETRMLTLLAALLAIPALVAGVTAIGFATRSIPATLPEMGGLTTWAAFPGTEIYQTEVRWFGIPLLIATFGAIVLGWFERRGRERFRRLRHRAGALAASSWRSTSWRSTARRRATPSARPSCPSGWPSRPRRAPR